MPSDGWHELEAPAASAGPNPSPVTRTITSPEAPTAVIHLEVPCLLPTDASFIGELGAHDAGVEAVGV